MAFKKLLSFWEERKGLQVFECLILKFEKFGLKLPPVSEQCSEPGPGREASSVIASPSAKHGNQTPSARLMGRPGRPCAPESAAGMPASPPDLGKMLIPRAPICPSQEIKSHLQSEWH